MKADTTPSEERLLTVEEFERLPYDEGRSELVRGRVVREPPAGFSHGALASRINVLLAGFVRERNLGIVVAAETGFVLSEEPSTVRAPDAAFVSHDRLPPEGPPAGFARFAPDLAVEVLSPSNTATDIQEKALDYLDAGTRAVWVVDPAARTVTVWRSRSEIRVLREDEELVGADALPGFRTRVGALFGD